MQVFVGVKALRELVDVLAGKLVDAPLPRVVQLPELELGVGQGLAMPKRGVEVEEGGVEVVGHEVCRELQRGHARVVGVPGSDARRNEDVVILVLSRFLVDAQA